MYCAHRNEKSPDLEIVFQSNNETPELNPRQLNNETSELNTRQPNNRAVGTSDNPGVPVLFDVHNLPPLVETGLTDLPKSGGVMTPPSPLNNETPELNARQEEISNLKSPPPYPYTFPPPPYPQYQKTLAVTTLRSGHIAPIKLPDQPLDLSKVVIDKEKYFKSIPFIPLTELDKRRTRFCDFPGCAKGYTKGSHLKAHQRLHTGKLFTYFARISRVLPRDLSRDDWIK